MSPPLIVGSGVTQNLFLPRVMVVLTKNGTPLPHYLLLLVVAVAAIMFEQRERNHRRRSTAVPSFSPPPESLPRVAGGGGGVAFFLSSFLGRGGVRRKMGWDVWGLDTWVWVPVFTLVAMGLPFRMAGACMATSSIRATILLSFQRFYM